MHRKYQAAGEGFRYEDAEAPARLTRGSHRFDMCSHAELGQQKLKRQRDRFGERSSRYRSAEWWKFPGRHPHVDFPKSQYSSIERHRQNISQLVFSCSTDANAPDLSCIAEHRIAVRS